MFHLKPTSSSMSLDYNEDTYLKLYLGDDIGTITILTFIQHREGLFRKKYNDKMTHFYWIELSDEESYVHIETFKKIHTNVIIKLIYYPETCSLVSCSRDNKNSVVFFNVKNCKKTYAFKISQGVCCFSINHQLHILLTGSDSGTIQLWNLYVSSKAITTLQGHKTQIIDGQILASKNIAITCSRDGVLKVWNLENHKCDQTLALKFPCFGVLGKLIEWGASSIYSGPKRLENMQNTDEKNHSQHVHVISHERQTKVDIWQRFPLLITCCNFVAKLYLNNDNNEFKNNILPPPPLQNEVIIPHDWRIEEPKIIKKDICLEQPEFDKSIIELHPMLKNIIERDFLKQMPRLKHDMNYKIAVLEERKNEMRKPVSQCAPFIALDLHEIEEVKLSPNLPVPNCKKTQQIVERTHRLLSAASTRSEILSDRSSKSRSSRSSIIEF